MKLSTKGRYAVMAMADLARQQVRGATAVPLADIASRQSISLAYLEQLFNRLRRSRLVEAQRGPGGGYRLSEPAADIRVLDIMLAVDEPIKTTRCDGVGSKGCAPDHVRCNTHHLWAELGHLIEAYLAGVSLEDVIERRNLNSMAVFVGDGPSAIPAASLPRSDGL